MLKSNLKHQLLLIQLFHNQTKHFNVSSQLVNIFDSPLKRNSTIVQNKCGLFLIPELTSCYGFYELKHNVKTRTNELIFEATNTKKQKRKMVEVFDDLSNSLCKVADLAEFIRVAHPDTSFSNAAEDTCISVSEIIEKLNTDRKLYNALKTVSDIKNRTNNTDAIDKHVEKLFLFDFEQSGIQLPENQRQQVVSLNSYILQLGQKFMARAAHPTTISRHLLPENIIHHFSIEDDKVNIAGLYTDSSNSLAREVTYKLFLKPDKQQENVLQDILDCRDKLARICGFKTFAHRALKASTVETPEMVHQFLNKLSDGIKPRAEEDFKIMQKMKKSDGSKFLEAWDTPYFTSKIKQKYLQVSPSEFSSFFSLGTCMEGLNILVQSLFGITLKNVEVLPGEVWTTDIYKLAVIHETEGLLGYIYCDFFERSMKPNQDCHFTIQGGKIKMDGSYQLPIVVIMLNLNSPKWSTPTLLTPPMVDNLFHEFGHAVHSMLGRTKYQHVAGTRCVTDFAEVPSVLMEYFANDPRVLKTFAKHFKTQEPMPQNLLQRLCASKHLFSASETQLQIFYSALDQAYHTKQQRNTTETLKQIQEKYYGLPYIHNTAWQLRFSHLIGYGAKYYSYLCSRAIASWIWHEYFEDDPLNRKNGEKYRRECLTYGGALPSKDIVSKFLKQEVTPENLAANLVNEIEHYNEKIIEID